MIDQASDLNILKASISVPMNWATGKAVGKFLSELGNNCQIYGTRCNQCQRVMVPPQEYCGFCNSDADEWVEVSDRGILKCFTVVYHAFPLQPCEPPYALGLIQLDRADTSMLHLIKEADLSKIYCGLMVEAVWREKREGSLFDIAYFKPAGGERTPKKNIGEPKMTVASVSKTLEVPYNYSYGYYMGHFFEELRDYKRIWGVRCPECRGVLVPPQGFCSECFVPTVEWVRVEDTGVLNGFGIVEIPFVGQITEPPYVYAHITLDGSHTNLAHILGEVDMAKVKDQVTVGSRVQAVWEDERKGSLRDIKYFKIISPSED